MDKLKLLDQMRAVVRTLHYSIRTEYAYVDWARRYFLFHNRMHPAQLGAPQVQAFLSHSTSERRASASTQKQAKAALLFLHRRVLLIELLWLDQVVSAKSSKRLPVVLPPREVRDLLLHTTGRMSSGLQPVVWQRHAAFGIFALAG